jgi:hypothetical protein
VDRVVSAAFYWFGVLHVAAYALVGFSYAAMFFADWIIRRFKLKADFMRVVHRMFQERNAKKRTGA